MIVISKFEIALKSFFYVDNDGQTLVEDWSNSFGSQAIYPIWTEQQVKGGHTIYILQ